jgi:hypothetical protein
VSLAGLEMITSSRRSRPSRDTDGNVALLSPSSEINGGTTKDFNAYIYGNNPFNVWTNAVKRMTINGDGSTEFSGTVSGLDAVTSSHFVTKGQFDSKFNGQINKFVKFTSSSTIGPGAW